MEAPQPAQSMAQGKEGSMSTDQGASSWFSFPAALRSGHSSRPPWMTKFSKIFFSTRLSMSVYMLLMSRCQLLSGSVMAWWNSSR